MIISKGVFQREAQALESSDSSALYLGNTLNLVDGIPSTACALQWLTSSPSTSDWVHMPWRMVPAPTEECRIFALLGLQNIPVGVRVELYGGATSNPGTLLSLSEVVQFPNGEYGVWIVREPGEGWTHEYFAWRILNDDGNTSPIASEQVIYIGELYASPAWDWCLTDISIELIDQSLVNTSAGGASRRIKWTPYRNFQGVISPKSWDIAILDPTQSLQALQFDLMAQDNIAVIPRPRWPIAGPISEEAITAIAMFGVLTRVGPLSSNAQIDRWPLQIAMQESP
jgi:hypothetical protein